MSMLSWIHVSICVQVSKCAHSLDRKNVTLCRSTEARITSLLAHDGKERLLSDMGCHVSLPKSWAVF